MKSNAGSVFDAARKVVPVDWADAEPAPTPTAPVRTSPAAPTIPANESFLNIGFPLPCVAHELQETAGLPKIDAARFSGQLQFITFVTVKWANMVPNQ